MSMSPATRAPGRLARHPPGWYQSGAQMVGRRAKWGAAATGLSAIGGCHGGLTLNAIVLLVTVGIFVATILLERSP